MMNFQAQNVFTCNFLQRGKNKLIVMRVFKEWTFCLLLLLTPQNCGKGDGKV